MAHQPLITSTAAPAAGGKTMPKIIDNKRFENPWPTWKGLPSLWEAAKWYFITGWWNRKHDSIEEIERELAIHETNFATKIVESGGDQPMTVTWLGHATVLVQMEGFNVLTDPVFSHSCGPFPYFFGRRRYRPPPCTVDQLPQIHAVVISHNHYDHLDVCAVRSLNARFGSNIRWYVPLGMAGWFRKCGVRDPIEMNWWESRRLSRPINNDEMGSRGELEIVFLPCQHWSARSFFDRNLSLWGSWAVIGRRHRFYFAGDTGYCPEFRNIGAHYGPFDAAAIPIGCYTPRHFMRNQHADPSDAVKIHGDIRSKYSLGIHWGTYAMGSTESELAPKRDLRTELEKAGIEASRFFTLRPGQSWRLPPADEQEGQQQ